MPKHRWGCQLPNDDGRSWTPEAIADIYGNGVFVLMQDQLRHLPRLVELLPEAIFLLRMYLPDWYTTDPVEWGRHCAVVYKQVKYLTKFITLANEQNLRAESNGVIGADLSHGATRQDYEVIRDWNLEAILAFRAAGGEDAILVFPALAYGHSDDQDDSGEGWIGLEIMAPIIDLCDIGAIHLYVQKGKAVNDVWEGTGRWPLQAKWFTQRGKKIIVSETGCFEAGTPGYAAKLVAIGRALDAHPENVGTVFFIHSDPTHHHADNDMSRSPQPYDAIRDAIQQGVPARPDWKWEGDIIMAKTPPKGRAWWVWEVSECGGVQGIIAACRQTSTTTIFLKGGDGPAFWSRQMNEATIRDLTAAGLNVYGWYYFYGGTGGSAHGAAEWTVDDEIDVATRIAKMPGLRGFIADVEAESAGRWQEAEKFARAVRGAIKDMWFGYSPIPVIDLHATLPYVQFNSECDAVLPQFYARHLGTGSQWTYASLAEIWRRWYDTWQISNLPVPPALMPVGEAYGVAQPADIREFEAIAAASSWPSWSYWSLQHALVRPDLMAVFGAPPPPPPTDTDVAALRDECYALASRLQATAVEWQTLGYLHHASVTENLLEAYKSAIALGKGEK